MTYCCQFPCRKSSQFGFTVAELMVSCTLGMLLTLVGIGLLLSARTSFLVLNEHAALQETAGQALALIARAVRQAAWRDWTEAGIFPGPATADIKGLDASSLYMSVAGIEEPLPQPVNGSDVLALRFMGAGSGNQGDGTMQNCAGFGVPANSAMEKGRGWSIFYVAAGRNGEPELRCKYQGQNSWRAEAIARGIESFQVLYGIDTDADGLPNQYVNAARLDRMTLELADDESEGHQADPETYWKKVVSLKIAVLARSDRSLQEGKGNRQYHLFGAEYSDVFGDSDAGTRIDENRLPDAVRRRLRKVFTVTLYLRNDASGI